jgi:hypothetical protein
MMVHWKLGCLSNLFFLSLWELSLFKDCVCLLMNSHSNSLLSFRSCVPSHKLSFDFSPIILEKYNLELSQLFLLLFYAIAMHCSVANFLFLACCGVMQCNNVSSSHALLCNSSFFFHNIVWCKHFCFFSSNVVWYNTLLKKILLCSIEQLFYLCTM